MPNGQPEKTCGVTFAWPNVPGAFPCDEEHKVVKDIKKERSCQNAQNDFRRKHGNYVKRRKNRPQ